MYRIALFALMAATAFAQTETPPPEKPPAEVEQALRARVTEFYTLLKNKQYRKAEALIAEDTKDYYYAGPKPEIHNFELLDIQYSEHFTRAKVITSCTEPVVVAGFPPTEITLKVPTLWKIENGTWAVYEDPDRMNGFGGVQRKIDSAMSGAFTGARAEVPEISKDSAFIFGKVQFEKQEIDLEPGKSESVFIFNAATGPVILQLGYPLKGIEAKLDRTDLGGGQKAVLTLTAGKEPVGGLYTVLVKPTEEILSVKVNVK